MTTLRPLLAAVLSLATAGLVRAADPPRPVKVLLVCGGCCHDYTRQKAIIARGLADRAEIEVTAVQEGGTATNSKIPTYEKDGWAAGYDVVIHDDCFSDVKDPAYTAKVLAPHKAGVPAVVLHCAMHSYRDGTDEWFKFCGVTSRRHGAAYPHEVLNNDPADPIMARFGPAWFNPAGELYWIEKVWPTAHPLGSSKNRERGTDEVCVWTNAYGDNKTRVFGTTLGHGNETVGHPAFLDLLTRGTLWAAGKLEPAYLKPEKPKVLSVNPAKGRPATASSEEAGKGNLAANAFDGDPSTRWCAAGPGLPAWVRVDLGKPTRVHGVGIDWEESGAVYKYKVEGSAEGERWTTLVDGSKNEEAGPVDRAFPPASPRYVRATILGTGGGWASLFELTLRGDETARVDPAAERAKPDPRLAGVVVPEGFEATVFAAPPAVSYPIYNAAAPDGTLYVSTDRNGSLDREPHRGSVLRLRDLDGDGKADEVKRFVADVDSPRGLVWDRDRLYLMHPPDLSAFIDRDGDGVADEEKTLVKGIAFGFKDRPADHTSNGVTLGIDGWLYLAIGDFGFVDAVGTDGKHLQLRGGGVVRVRPDGTGLELYSRGTRNILEVGLDPLLNGFARDNTNDGDGWDIRLHHFTGMEEHGYPSLYKNFADEAVAPLADYGGGSGCGSLFLSEPGFPGGYNDRLYTADWGRERIFRHKLTPKGATFTADQHEFLTLARVTDLDVDALGHLYATSLRGATFTYAGEDVGSIIRVTPKGYRADPLPDFARLDRAGLLKQLESPSHRRRLAAQREIIARALADGRLDAKRASLRRETRDPTGTIVPVRDVKTFVGLDRLATDPRQPIATRVAALFALKEAFGPPVIGFLKDLDPDPVFRAAGLRALADRAEEPSEIIAKIRTARLGDADPRVRLQAIEAVAKSAYPSDELRDVVPRLADPDPIVAQTAIKALVHARSRTALLAVLDDPAANPAVVAGALRALQAIYETRVAAGLIERLARDQRPDRRLALIGALARLDHREGFWRGDGWGTRPDTSGPYYQPEAWSASPEIEKALAWALGGSSEEVFGAILKALDRNKVAVDVDAIVAKGEADPTTLPAIVAHLAGGRSVPAKAVPLLAKVASDKGGSPALRSAATVALFRSESDEGLVAALGSLARLGAEGRESTAFAEARAALLAGARGGRVAKFEAIAGRGEGEASAWADAALLVVAGEAKGQAGPRDLARKAVDAGWRGAKRRAQILRAVALVGHQGSAARVLSAIDDADPSVASAAREAATALKLDPNRDAAIASGPKVEGMKTDAVLDAVFAAKGDRATGERVFARLNCANCHTVRQGEPAKGPYLGTIATTYKRRELAEAILLPSKTIAQGFVTNVFALEDGRNLTGFVVKEASDAVTLRDGEGKEVTLPTATIVDRAKSDTSVMPEGLVKGLSIGEFASLVDYLESLSRAGGKP